MKKLIFGILFLITAFFSFGQVQPQYNSGFMYFSDSIAMQAFVPNNTGAKVCILRRSTTENRTFKYKGTSLKWVEEMPGAGAGGGTVFYTSSSTDTPTLPTNPAQPFDMLNRNRFGDTRQRNSGNTAWTQMNNKNGLNVNYSNSLNCSPPSYAVDFDLGNSFRFDFNSTSLGVNTFEIPAPSNLSTQSNGAVYTYFIYNSGPDTFNVTFENIVYRNIWLEPLDTFLLGTGVRAELKFTVVFNEEIATLQSFDDINQRNWTIDQIDAAISGAGNGIISALPVEDVSIAAASHDFRITGLDTAQQTGVKKIETFTGGELHINSNMEFVEANESNSFQWAGDATTLSGWGSGNGPVPVLNIFRGRGTRLLPTSIQAGDAIGGIVGRGYTSTAATPGSRQAGRMDFGCPGLNSEFYPKATFGIYLRGEGDNDPFNASTNPSFFLSEEGQLTLNDYTTANYNLTAPTFVSVFAPTTGLMSKAKPDSLQVTNPITNSGLVSLRTALRSLNNAIVAGGSGTVTSVDGSGGTTGLTLTGGPITTAGTLTLGGILAVANGGTGSATQGWVDLTTTQASIGGAKGFVDAATVGSGTGISGQQAGTIGQKVVGFKGGTSSLTEANYQDFSGLAIETIDPAGSNDNQTTNLIATGSDATNGGSEVVIKVRPLGAAKNTTEGIAVRTYATGASTDLPYLNIGNIIGDYPATRLNIPLGGIGFEGGGSPYKFEQVAGGFQVSETNTLRTELVNGLNDWQTPSDKRLKTKVRELSVLDRIGEARGVEYVLKDSGKRQYGVIAQEIAKPFPHAVHKNENGFYTVGYGAIGAIAFQGVKELAEENDLLKERLNQLNDRLLKLEREAGFEPNKKGFLKRVFKK